MLACPLQYVGIIEHMDARHAHCHTGAKDDEKQRQEYDEAA